MSTLIGLDLASPILTDVDRSVRYERNQDRAVSFIPYCISNFFSNAACCTVSNAAERSRSSRIAFDFLSSNSIRSLTTFRVAVSQLWYLR